MKTIFIILIVILVGFLFGWILSKLLTKLFNFALAMKIKRNLIKGKKEDFNFYFKNIKDKEINEDNKYLQYNLKEELGKELKDKKPLFKRIFNNKKLKGGNISNYGGPNTGLKHEQVSGSGEGNKSGEQPNTEQPSTNSA